MKIHHLVVYSGATVSRVYVLNKERVLIGRDLGCDLTFDSINISRRHVLLHCAEDQVTIEDLSSTNGTEVNGELLQGLRVLQPRDEVLLGKDFRFIFQSVDAVRTEAKEKVDQESRPAYPLPLPQTTLLNNEPLEQTSQDSFAWNEGPPTQRTISPDTLPQPRREEAHNAENER